MKQNQMQCFHLLLNVLLLTQYIKKEERTIANNYRPVSILPPISKIFERNMYDQIYAYIDNYLSPYLCGFRKGFSTQHCLTVMLEC